LNWFSHAQSRSTTHRYRPSHPFVAQSVSAAAPELAGFRGVGVLIASTFECVIPEGTAPAWRLPWPERLLSVTLKTMWGEVDVHNLYVPVNYQRGHPHLPDRIATLKAVYTRLARPSNRHRILCGDFNLPRQETTDGEVVTFGQEARTNGSYRVWSADADAAERGVLLGLGAHDLRDVYRQLHGYARQESSWELTNRGKVFGFRPDHVLASSSLRATACRYLHEFREPWAVRPWRGTARALSDHSAIEAVFDPVRTG
jgi:exonuclease III